MRTALTPGDPVLGARRRAFSLLGALWRRGATVGTPLSGSRCRVPAGLRARLDGSGEGWVLLSTLLFSEPGALLGSSCIYTQRGSEGLTPVAPNPKGTVLTAEILAIPISMEREQGRDLKAA